MSRRSRTEVMVDILKAAAELMNGSAKTRIMYRANLNFLRFEKYFAELSKRGLIELVDNPGSNTMVYRTTKKGKTFLELVKKMEEFVNL